jgi:uncharacterized protein (TIGR02118 family)
VVRFTILWKSKPTDVQAFERHYHDVHLPLALKLAGLRRYTLGRDMTPVRGGEPYYLIAELEWDDMASFQRAFESPEGRATSEDMANLIGLVPDVQSMVYEVENVYP